MFDRKGIKLMSGRLAGQRVLVTSADRYLGPAVVDLFGKEGAEVIADTSDYTAGPDVPKQVVERAGHVDVLVPIFAGPLRIMPFTNMLGPVTEFKDSDLQAYLDELVWPMVRFVRAVLPQMYERRQGKIVAVTSASPMRAIEGLGIYTGCRGYQNAFLMVAGAEAAHHNVQINGIGPAFIENPSYFTPQMLADPDVRKSLTDIIPAERICDAWEAAELVLDLATHGSNFLAGQIIPISGGWATR
jgi:2-keto-3-deoxy-L-fuconate dehydrogenase